MASKNPVDMQVHSSFSPDAQYTPDELFSFARQADMHAIVITDHNGIRGIKPAADAAVRHGVETLQGVEISTKYGTSDVHVLGYSTNFKIDIIDGGMESTRRGYNERSRLIIEKINEAKVALIDFGKLLEQFKNSYVSKPAIGQEIANQRGIPYREAIKLVERGGLGYVPYGNWAMSPADAVTLIHRAGGMAVLAHPGDFFTTRSSETHEQARQSLYRLLDELIILGLDGIEVFYSKHKPDWNQEFLTFAENHDLLVSGGSDYHGPKYNDAVHLGDGGISVDRFEHIKVRATERSQV